MKTVLTIIFFSIFFLNPAWSFEGKEIDKITFNCTNLDGSGRIIEYEKGGFSSNKKYKVEKILWDSKWDVVQVHFDDSRFIYVDNLTGDFSAMDGKILDFKCNFVVATQSENKTESKNQNSNNLENLILDNIDLIKKLEKQIEQLEIRIAKLEENKNIEQVMSSTDGRKIQLNDDGTYNILENDNSNVINVVTLDCKVDNKEEIRVFKFEVGQTQQDVGKVVLEIINEESTKNIQIKLEENNLAQVDGSDGSLFFNGSYTNSKCTPNFE